MCDEATVKYRPVVNIIILFFYVPSMQAYTFRHPNTLYMEN